MRHDQNGFSLLETLIAIVIFSIGALSILLVLSKSKTDAINLDYRLQAAMLLNQGAALVATHHDILPLVDSVPQLLPEGNLTLSQEDPPQLVISWRNHNTQQMESITYGNTP